MNYEKATEEILAKFSVLLQKNYGIILDNEGINIAREYIILKLQQLEGEHNNEKTEVI